MSVIDRAKAIVEELEYTNAKLSRKIGVKESTIYNLFRKGKNYNFLQAMAKTFPNLNMRWLLLGEGERWLNKEDQATYTQTDSNSNNSNLIAAKDREIALIKQMLDSEVKRLEQLLQTKDEMIALLKEKK